jgi:hypothetical protein
MRPGAGSTASSSSALTADSTAGNNDVLDRHRADLRRPGPTRSAVNLPVALEGGDVETALLIVELQPAGGSLEDYARRMSGMLEIAATIRWTFVQTKGLPRRWRLIPARLQRRRERVSRSADIVLDASHYRRAAIEHWRTRDDWANLAEIAERG